MTINTDRTISLSYVLTTFNKIDYLKITLPALIAAKKDDEEIVIADGGSTDGTPEYLQSLYLDGKIQQYISAPDKGESHGLNKTILMAKGELIKIITDDDAYHFDAIGKCKDFMLGHPEIDVLGFDGYGYNVSNEVPYFDSRDSLAVFKLWKEERKPFIFCGLSLMLRRTSIALLGLFNTTVKIIDFEFTMRITATKCKLAWYTGCYYVNIANADSNSIKFWRLCNIEEEKISYLYLNKLPLITFENIDRAKNLIRPVKRLLKGKIKIANTIPFEKAFQTARDKLYEPDLKGEFFW